MKAPIIAAAILIVGASSAMAGSSGIAAPPWSGVKCAQSIVGGVHYAWNKLDASMTTIFQSSADNNRSINVVVSSDLGLQNLYPTVEVCSGGDKTIPTPLIAGP